MEFENQILKGVLPREESIKKSKTEKDRQTEWEESNHKKLVFAFGKIFKENSNSKDRLSKFNEGLSKVLETFNKDEISQEIANEIEEKIKDVCLLNDENAFIEQGLVAIKPIIDWQRENRGLFEAKEREAFINSNGYITLNEMLSYGRDEDSLHIHVAPSTTLDVGTKFILLKNGFRNLQELLRNDESIKEVTATSWIVATESGRGILEKFGFTVEDIMPSKRNDREGRSVASAHISREDLLRQRI